LEEGCVEPKIYVGLTREGFKMNHDMSRVDNVWAINLATGDKYNKLKWKDYYIMDKD